MPCRFSDLNKYLMFHKFFCLFQKLVSSMFMYVTAIKEIWSFNVSKFSILDENNILAEILITNKKVLKMSKIFFMIFLNVLHVNNLQTKRPIPCPVVDFALHYSRTICFNGCCKQLLAQFSTKILLGEIKTLGGSFKAIKYCKNFWLG